MNSSDQSHETCPGPPVPDKEQQASPADGQTTRRELPQAVAAAALGALVVPRRVLGGPAWQPPSDTLRIAGIGVGGMGRRYLEACESEKIVALCDVDHGFAAKVFKRYPKAAVHRDWRALFDKEKEFDAVIVATPDHNHAAITLTALGLGKHVYCAKPLTQTIAQARKVAAAAKQAKVATQTSVQTCASDEACSIAELLGAGIIGPVREVHVWTDHPLYPAGLQRPTDTPSLPPDLDWNLWIGPAPMRPYHPIYHPWTWRSWWDFGTGTVGDMLCHALHVFYEPLQLSAPVSVCGSRTTMHGGFFRMEPDGREHLPPRMATPETESYSSIVTWDFAQRGALPPLRLHWYDGGMKPHRPIELNAALSMPNSGVLYVGEKGKMLTGYSGGKPRLLPEQHFKSFTPPAKTLARSPGHYREWISAAKTGSRTNCNFGLGAGMTEIALLGTLAARSAKYLQWDSATGRITNDQEMNGLVDRPVRKGW